MSRSTPVGPLTNSSVSAVEPAYVTGSTSSKTASVRSAKEGEITTIAPSATSGADANPPEPSSMPTITSLSRARGGILRVTPASSRLSAAVTATVPPSDAVTSDETA
jgi:hypothetical protein